MRRRSLVLILLFAAACGTAAEPPPSPTPGPPSPSPTPAPSPPRPADPFALARSYDVATPGELVSRISGAERAIAAGDDLADQGVLQQAAYRQLVRTPEWREEVYGELAEQVRAIAERHVEAGERLRSLTAPRPSLPDWEVVEPPPASELREHYRAAADEFGIGWEYLAAIHLVETRMGRIRGTSVAGARGPMQFMPATWAAYGEGDIEDPRDAIFAAGRYLQAHGAPGNMQRALYAYNHSDHYVRAIEIHAERMREEPNAHVAYHHWQVYYRTTDGDALLYEGWPSR